MTPLPGVTALQPDPSRRLATTSSSASGRWSRACANWRVYWPAPTGLVGTAVTSSDRRNRSTTVTPVLGGCHLVPHRNVPTGDHRPAELGGPLATSQLEAGTHGGVGGHRQESGSDGVGILA